MKADIVEDVLIESFGYLPLNDLVRSVRFCREWYRILSENIGQLLPKTFDENNGSFYLIPCKVYDEEALQNPHYSIRYRYLYKKSFGRQMYTMYANPATSVDHLKFLFSQVQHVNLSSLMQDRQSTDRLRIYPSAVAQFLPNRLLSMNLSRMHLTFIQFSKLLQNFQILHLDLTMLNVDWSMATVKKLGNFSFVESLVVDHNWLPWPDMFNFLSNFPNLKHLSMRNTGLGKFCFTDLQCRHTLETLDLSLNEIPAEDILFFKLDCPRLVSTRLT